MTAVRSWILEIRWSFIDGESTMAYASASKEGSYCPDHFIELRSGKLGKHRQRQHFERRTFRLGALPVLVPEIREARL
jgi:hypothetical protein